MKAENTNQAKVDLGPGTKKASKRHLRPEVVLLPAPPATY